MVTDTESLSEPSLSPGQSLTWRQKKCDEMSNKSPGNRTGKKEQQAELKYLFTRATHTHAHGLLYLYALIDVILNLL